LTPEEEEILRRRAKAELRKRLRALRTTTPASAIADRSAKIVDALDAMPIVRAAKTIALFWPILERHEVDLRALDARLRTRARVAYPSIDRAPTDTETNAMVFRFVGDPASIKDEGFGFLEPPPSAPVANDLDVIVCPALAIDPRGHRLGYGAGYYDRALRDRSAASIGVVFDFQFLPEVPTSATDVPVRFVVTDARTLEIP